MRNGEPTTIAPAVDDTTFLVIEDFGRGPIYRETAAADSNRETIIGDMLSAQYDRPIQVVAVNLLAGRARDASQEIAREVLARAQQQDRELAAGVRDFVEAFTMERK